MSSNREKEIQRLKKQNQLLQKENLSLKIQLDAPKKLAALRKHPKRTCPSNL